MSAEERAYRLLLRAYPAEFRADYEDQMLLVFRDLRRERGDRMLFWLNLIVDTLRSAPALRLEPSRGRLAGTTHLNGGIMKTMSILAVLVGALTIANSALEGWTGGVMNHDGQSLLAGLLGIAAGVSIVAAGILLMRRGEGSMTLAQGAALACLAAFVLMLVVSPRLSIFANILGIGFPLILVGYVQLSRGKGRQTPLMG